MSFSPNRFLKARLFFVDFSCYVLQIHFLLLFFYPLMNLCFTVQVPKTGRREIHEGTRIQGCTICCIPRGNVIISISTTGSSKASLSICHMGRNALF